MNKFKLDFIGIGVPRAGTTWIYNILKDHPQICMSSTKETKFFNDDNEYNKGLNYYKKSYFDNMPQDKINGEFDPGYFNHIKSANRIYKDFPYTKILICLRNPIDRAHSHFLKHKLKGKKHIDNFSKILSNTPNIYLENSIYSEKIENYISLFGRDKILILFYEELKNDPINFSKKIYKFLGVNTEFKSGLLNTKINFTGERKARFLPLNYFVFYAERLFTKNKLLKKFILPIIKMLRIHNLRKIIFRLNMNVKSKVIDKKQIDDKINEELINFFKNDKKELENLIGHKINIWN